MPVVHIEAHGDELGLIVSSGEHVPWTDLKDALTQINMSGRLHLLVVMAMCRGIHLSRILLPMEPAPVWAVVGPVREPTPRDIAAAMTAFYRGLLKLGDGEQALIDMNGARSPEKWDFGFMNAEWLFCESFRRHLEDLTPESLAERENQMVTEFLQRRGSYDLMLATEARTHARAILRDHKAYFDLLKSTYFMFEQWPENRDRFRLEYTDCSGQSSTTPEFSVAANET